MTLRFHPIWLLMLCLSGCSWLVSPEKGEIKCKGERGGDDPCPSGTVCQDGVCHTQRCAHDEVCEDGFDNDCDDKIDEHDPEVEEKCDGVDNDCDGHVDNINKPDTCNQEDSDCDGHVDEDADSDKDGFTICGDGVRANTIDCEDLLAGVHPGAEEVCDGLDNDCDGNTDNAVKGKQLCSANQLCSDGRCLTRTCAVPNSGVLCLPNERCVDDVCQPMNCATPCKEGQFCDTKTFTCVDVPRQRKIGESCTLDGDCVAEAVCIDAAALYLTEPPRRVCGKACCSDAECAAGETCFASGTGARSCLPSTLALNINPNNAKSCTVSNDCPSPQVCAEGESTQGPGTRKLATTVCRPPGLLEQAYLSQCGISPNCTTHLCLKLLLSNVCTTPCRVTSDCTRLTEYNSILRGYCQYVDLGEYMMSAASNYAPICLAMYEDPPKLPPGCKTNVDCPEGTCIGASTSAMGKCAATCCNDSQCRMTRPNARCIPVARGAGRFEMRCIE